MQANLAHLLTRTARCMPEQPAVFLGADCHATFAELADRVGRAAHGLQLQLGLRHGDRVAIAMGNCPQYVELMFAIWHAGLCAVPVNAKLHPREIAYIVEHSGARVCFVDDALNAAVTSALDHKVLTIVADDAADYEPLFSFAPIEPAAVANDEIAWLFYTSGTTGQPKGAMLSHRNLTAMSWSHGGAVGPVSARHRLIHAAPMSHGSGLYLLPYLAEGAAQVIPRSGGFDVAEMVELIAAHPSTRFFAAPTMLRRLVEHVSQTGAAVGNLETVICGGAPLYLEDC
ncbi:MAG TPA: long-chain fatty acid--CoA ligase, partial [Rhodocyclaceae bacterium]|nr:long-chain fatty acid--CoA ligase [Rhodocyclaceae bacterium]